LSAIAELFVVSVVWFEGALKIHYSAVHLREMHRCTIAGCDMVFSSRRSRNRHSANPNPKLHSADAGGHVMGGASILMDGMASRQTSRSPSPSSRLYRTSSDPALQFTDHSSDDEQDEPRGSSENDSGNGNADAVGEITEQYVVATGTQLDLEAAASCDDVPDRPTTRVCSKRKRSVPTRCVAERSASRDDVLASSNGVYETQSSTDFDGVVDDNVEEEEVGTKQRRHDVENRAETGQSSEVEGQAYADTNTEVHGGLSCMTSSHHETAGVASCRRNLISSFGADVERFCDVTSAESCQPFAVVANENCNGREEDDGEELTGPCDGVATLANDDVSGSCSTCDHLQQQQQQQPELTLPLDHHYHHQNHDQLDVQHICTVPGCNAIFPSKRSRDRHSSNFNLHRKLLSTSEVLAPPSSPPTDDCGCRSPDGIQHRPALQISRTPAADPSLALTSSHVMIPDSVSVAKSSATSDAETSSSGESADSGDEDGAVLMTGSHQHRQQNGYSEAASIRSPIPVLSGLDVDSSPSTLAVCHLCQQSFRDNLVLKEHIETVHPREMFPCTVDGCNKIFSTRKSRNRHSQNDNLHRKLPVD